MKKLILKIPLYLILMLLCLELLVRIFHLAKDTPTRYVDDYQVEKWKPNQNGFAVTGNRRQNFSEYRINNSGFNSYREFKATKENFEIALVGDSFIEGFHQHYYNSIGKKVEKKLDTVSVFEYGYAGYDLANQLHLIHQYKEQFKDVDKVILGLKYENDLFRSKYQIETSRLALESPLNRMLKKSKLLVYAKSIGALNPLLNFVNTIKNFRNVKTTTTLKKTTNIEVEVKARIANLEALVNLYGFNKTKYYFLLDETITPKQFVTYLAQNGYKFISIGKKLQQSTKNTTLIYDMHWNNLGREIIANEIVSYLNAERTATVKNK